MAKRGAAAAAAALLSISSLTAPALATEFDILAEETPTKYFLDDAGVLSRSTRSDLNKRLSILEVSWLAEGAFPTVFSCDQPVIWQPAKQLDWLKQVWHYNTDITSFRPI
eukprot:GHRR01022208.1.p2 GENE.GHRR01022208.1~~GHRR01022208.1.p2  ORF type:complete len:110 (-),score=36.12 GHRR01022208.1:1172-1501(-)